MVATFAALSVASCFLAYTTDSRWLKSLVVCDTMFQALLLGSTTVSFVAPLLITARRLLIPMGFILCMTCQLVAVQVFLPDWYYVSYGACVCFFLLQVWCYARTFRRSAHHTERVLDSQYDDDESVQRLRPAFHLYYSALTFGAVALIFLVSPVSEALYTSLVVFYTVYYAVVCVLMIRYRIIGDYIVKIVGEPVGPVMTAETVSDQVEPQRGNSVAGHYNHLEEALNAWVEQRGYIESDVTTEQLAERMGVSRSEFITYFQQIHNTNFRSWRMRMRLEEAERLIRTTPDLQVSCLYELVGFNDRSNFHTKFTEFTGLTPRAYQQKYGLS